MLLCRIHLGSRVTGATKPSGSYSELAVDRTPLLVPGLFASLDFERVLIFANHPAKTESALDWRVVTNVHILDAWSESFLRKRVHDALPVGDELREGETGLGERRNEVACEVGGFRFGTA